MVAGDKLSLLSQGLSLTTQADPMPPVVKSLPACHEWLQLVMKQALLAEVEGRFAMTMA